MSTHIYDLEVEVLSLGPAERAHLLERLIESFEPSSKVQDAWVSEAPVSYTHLDVYKRQHWARQYLVWEGLLDGSTRGIWTLTPLGYKAQLDTPASHKIFLKWVKVHASARKKGEEERSAGAVPTEVEVIADTDHKFLLLELLKKVTPEGFERICARLLRESGFETVSYTHLDVYKRQVPSTSTATTASAGISGSRWTGSTSSPDAPPPASPRSPKSSNTAWVAPRSTSPKASFGTRWPGSP